MKLIKGVVLFCFLGMVVSSCFDPPEFRDKPEIIFRKIYFGDDPNGQDSIVLVFDFKDGDGDLGLNDQLVDSPYHTYNFFLGTKPDPLEAIPSRLISNYSNVLSKKTNRPPVRSKYFIYTLGNGGDVATYSSRADYPSLPPYQVPYTTCEALPESYLRDTVYVHPKLVNAINKSHIVDTILFVADNSVAAYSVADTFYRGVNPNYYNFHVRFYQKVNNAFEEYNWQEEFCLNFDARLPKFSDKSGPQEGTISYTMKSHGFLAVFSIKTLYLEFDLADRALNKSSPEKTIEFTLNGIKQN